MMDWACVDNDEWRAGLRLQSVFFFLHASIVTSTWTVFLRLHGNQTMLVATGSSDDPKRAAEQWLRDFAHGVLEKVGGDQ